jgi:putative ABC transport system substrate-binding protein
MRRRELMPLLGGALTAGRAVRAQQKAMPMIGFLNPTMPSAAGPNMAALHNGLSKTGYLEGQNVAIEYRWAEGRVDRLPPLAADLVGRNADVIAAVGDAAVPAVKSATSTIPIVFFIGGDPVAMGYRLRVNAERGIIQEYAPVHLTHID